MCNNDRCLSMQSSCNNTFVTPLKDVFCYCYAAKQNPSFMNNHDVTPLSAIIFCVAAFNPVMASRVEIGTNRRNLFGVHSQESDFQKDVRLFSEIQDGNLGVPMSSLQICEQISVYIID